MSCSECSGAERSTRSSASSALLTENVWPALPDPKTILKENQKEIKKDVDQLYKLAQELKEESEKTDAYNVLSLPMIRKAEEIEKLAHSVKEKMKAN